MINLVNTKSYNFNVVQKNKPLAEQLTNLRKLLTQGKDLEKNLYKYAGIIQPVKDASFQFEWMTRLKVVAQPQKSDALQFEIYNWLIVLVQQKINCLLILNDDLQICEHLRSARGVLTFLTNPEFFQRFYDLEPLKTVVEGFINFELTLLMDANDDPHFSNQARRTPYDFLFSTCVLSVEQLSRQRFQDKVLNGVVQLFRTIQESRMLYLQHATIKEIQQQLNETQNIDLPPELVQQMSTRLAPLANKLLCTECEQTAKLETVYENGFEEIPFEGKQYVIWQ